MKSLIGGLCVIMLSVWVVYSATGIHRYTDLVLVWTLMVLAWTDYHYYLLPDRLTLPLLWLGLLLNAFGLYVNPGQSILGAGIGYSSLAAVGLLFKLMRGKQGLGQGDYKLLAALGAWFGPYALLTVVLIASSLGSVIGLSLIMIKKQTWQKPLPLGVFLAVAGFIELLMVNSNNIHT